MHFNCISTVIFKYEQEIKSDNFVFRLVTIRMAAALALPQFQTELISLSEENPLDFTHQDF